MDKQTKNLFRIGTVCDLDATGQRVRVNFDDLGTVSPWLQVPAFGANGDDYYWMPEVDEQVACFFMPTGNAEDTCFSAFGDRPMRRKPAVPASVIYDSLMAVLWNTTRGPVHLPLKQRISS